MAAVSKDSRRLRRVAFGAGSVVTVAIAAGLAVAASTPLANWRSTTALQREALGLFPLGTSSDDVRQQLVALRFDELSPLHDASKSSLHQPGDASPMMMLAMRRPAVEVAYLTHSTQFVFVFDSDLRLSDIRVIRYVLAF